MIEVVCFTGQSGLTDYSVSLARALGAKSRLVTAENLPERFRTLGFQVLTPFRRSRHYLMDLPRFVWGTWCRRPDWSLWQGPLKFPLLDGLAARLLRLAGVRCAVTVHDVLPHYPRPWSRFTFSFYYRSFDRVVVHSQAALQGVRTMGISAAALVVPHGVYDLFKLSDLSQQEARERLPQLGAGAGDRVSLFFGHLETRKGLFLALELARRCNRADLRFLISGAPSLSAAEMQRLEAEAAALPNVHLHAKRVPFEEVEWHFAASDVVLLPYLEGTTSGVLKLALAFGKPVLATAVGDFQEEVPADGGQCVPLGEQLEQRLAQALNEMLDDLPAWRSGMRDAGASQQWPVIASRLQAFLEGAD